MNTSYFIIGQVLILLVFHNYHTCNMHIAVCVRVRVCVCVCVCVCVFVCVCAWNLRSERYAATLIKAPAMDPFNLQKLTVFLHLYNFNSIIHPDFNTSSFSSAHKYLSFLNQKDLSSSKAPPQKTSFFWKGAWVRGYV